MVERHPDNVAASLYGGFIATFMNDLELEDMARRDTLRSEIIPETISDQMYEKPSNSPSGITHHRKLPFAKEIKAVAIIPNFEAYFLFKTSIFSYF